MKYILIFLLLFTISTFADTFRTFTDKSGRTVSAVIIKYNSSTERIQLKRKGARPIWISPSLFSKETQSFINNWIDNSKFMDSDNFKIIVKESTTIWKSIKSRKFAADSKKKTCYSIELKNNTNKVFKNLKLEYCIFRDRDYEGEKFIESDFSEKQIESIPGNSSKTIRSATYLSFKSNDFLNEVVGICIRIYMEPENTSVLMREERVPINLNERIYSWKKPDKKSSQQPKQQKQTEIKKIPRIDYSSINMSKDDVKALVEKYIDIWEDGSFEQWKKMLSDMHPDHRYLDEETFNRKSIKSYIIREIDGLNVRVTVKGNGGDDTGWFYLHNSGRIKYTPSYFGHPVAHAIRSLHFLYIEERASLGMDILKEAGIPLFGYHQNLSESKKQKSIKQIYEWLEKNGLHWDNSNPKVFLSKKHFKTLMEYQETVISYANFTTEINY